MKKSDLRKYAKLVAKVGANIQKGQQVKINATIEQSDFVLLVVEECYKAGASKVSIDWNVDRLTALNYKYQDLETLTKIEDWEIKKLERETELLPARIFISSANPDGLKGVDQAKMMKVRQEVGKVTKKYRDAIDNKHQWTIVAMPGVEWAKKIFPNESNKKAKELLWKAIYKTVRLEGDPIENWKKHSNNIASKNKILNDLNIKTLMYKSANGTDFKVSLTGKTVFGGGYLDTIQGVRYNPNMPTEESYTSPDKFSAEGVVYSTKPLSVMGNLVDNFGFRFEKGKVVEVLGDEFAKETLEKLISIDEGASYLGEVALVPFNSPVNETGILFYNTLFDENACCHLAIGAGFEDTIKDFEKKSPEELKEVGLNDSMIHVDFMIGSADLEITAETFDGKIIKIFEHGTWAI